MANVIYRGPVEREPKPSTCLLLRRLLLAWR